MNHCPFCRAPVEHDAKYCASCGRDLGAPASEKEKLFRYSCPSCGAPAKLGQSHCAYCKADLLAATPDGDLQAFSAPRPCAICKNPAPPGETYCLKCKDVLRSMGKDSGESEAPSHPCAHCGKLVWSGVPYCEDCKEMFVPHIAASARRCPNCNAPVDKDDPYCPSCFISLGDYDGAFELIRLLDWLMHIDWKRSASTIIGVVIAIALLIGGMVAVNLHKPIRQAQRADYQTISSIPAGVIFEVPKTFQGVYNGSQFTIDENPSKLLAYHYLAPGRRASVTVTVTQDPGTDIGALMNSAIGQSPDTVRNYKSGPDWYEFSGDSSSNKICCFGYGKLLEGRYYQLCYQYENVDRKMFSGYWDQLKARFRPLTAEQAHQLRDEPVKHPSFSSVSTFDYGFSFQYPDHFYLISDLKPRAEPNPFYYTYYASSPDNRAVLRVKAGRAYPAASWYATAPHTPEFVGVAHTVAEKGEIAGATTYAKQPVNGYKMSCDLDGRDLSLFEKWITDGKRSYFLEFLYPTSEKSIYANYLSTLDQKFLLK